MSLVARRYLGQIDASKKVERISVDEVAKRYKNDFLGFCELLDIVTKGGVRRKLTPLKSTQKIFNDARTGRDAVLKPRQVAITTIELARDIWFWIVNPSSKVVVVCQSATEHGPLKDIAGKATVMIEALERANVALHWKSFSANEWSLEGRDGSLRIIEAGASEAAAQKKGRGGTIHRLHVTEVAFYEYADATLNALLESVPDRKYGTEIVFETTSNGAAGWFYEHYQAAKRGLNGFVAHFLRWFDFDEYRTELEPDEVLGVPTDKDQADREAAWRADGVTDEQIKWYRGKRAEKKRQELVDQEYPSDEDTCWLIAGNGFFDQGITNLLIHRATPPIERIAIRRPGAIGELRIFHRAEPGRVYVISSDTAEGSGGDQSTAHVYERVTGRYMATLDGQFKPWELARELGGRKGQQVRGAPAPDPEAPQVFGLGQRYGWALIAVERNNHGHTVLRCLVSEQRYPNIFVDRDEKPGWLNHEVTRGPALDTLEEAHRTGAWAPKDKVVLGQLRTFIINKKGKAEAAKGAYDDHVIAGAIGWDVICRAFGQQRRGLGGLDSA